MKIYSLCILLLVSIPTQSISQSKFRTAIEWIIKAGETDNNDQKIKYYTNAIEVYPIAGHTYVLRGNIYYSNAWYKEAINDFNQAISWGEPGAMVYIYRARAYVATDQYRKAITDLTEALKLNPKDGNIYYVRGMAYRDIKLYKDAIDDYDRAIKLGYRTKDVYKERGIAKYHSGIYRDALLDFNNAIELNSNDTGLFAWRGAIYYLYNENEMAIYNFDRALEINPNDETIIQMRSLCSKKLGKSDEIEFTTKDELEKNKNLKLDLSHYKVKNFSLKDLNLLGSWYSELDTLSFYKSGEFTQIKKNDNGKIVQGKYKKIDQILSLHFNSGKSKRILISDYKKSGLNSFVKLDGAIYKQGSTLNELMKSIKNIKLKDLDINKTIKELEKKK